MLTRFVSQYRDKDYLKVLLELVNITHSHPHMVSEIGLCNFDTKHTEEACAFLLEQTGKVGIVSNQVQVTCPSVIITSRDLDLLTPTSSAH